MPDFDELREFLFPSDEFLVIVNGMAIPAVICVMIWYAGLYRRTVVDRFRSGVVGSIACGVALYAGVLAMQGPLRGWPITETMGWFLPVSLAAALTVAVGSAPMKVAWIGWIGDAAIAWFLVSSITTELRSYELGHLTTERQDYVIWGVMAAAVLYRLAVEAIGEKRRSPMVWFGLAIVAYATAIYLGHSGSAGRARLAGLLTAVYVACLVLSFVRPLPAGGVMAVGAWFHFALLVTAWATTEATDPKALGALAAAPLALAFWTPKRTNDEDERSVRWGPRVIALLLLLALVGYAVWLGYENRAPTGY